LWGGNETGTINVRQVAFQMVGRGTFETGRLKFLKRGIQALPINSMGFLAFVASPKTRPRMIELLESLIAPGHFQIHHKAHCATPATPPRAVDCEYGARKRVGH
jgi:hypothetical protein